MKHLEVSALSMTEKIINILCISERVQEKNHKEFLVGLDLLVLEQNQKTIKNLDQGLAG